MAAGAARGGRGGTTATRDSGNRTPILTYVRTHVLWSLGRWRVRWPRTVDESLAVVGQRPKSPAPTDSVPCPGLGADRRTGCRHGIAQGRRGRGSNPQPLSNNPYGVLDVGANALRFRVPRNLFQRWNESPVPPFKQLREGLDVRRARMEVVALIGVLLRQTDDIEQVLPDLFGVRRGLPLFAPALPHWASGAVNVCRPNGDGVSSWSVAWVIPAIGIERVRDVQIADLAMARSFPVEVSTAPLSFKRPIEPARAAAVGATVGHWFLPWRVGNDRLRALIWRTADGSAGSQHRRQRAYPHHATARRRPRRVVQRGPFRKAAVVLVEPPEPPLSPGRQ